MKNSRKEDTERRPVKMVLTPRDRRILEHINIHDGMLTDYQVQALEFTGYRQATDRLSKLFHNGYLARPSQQERKKAGEMFYWLTEMGAATVARVEGKPPKNFKWRSVPLWNQIEHDIRVNDVWITATVACRDNPEFDLFEWIPETIFRSDPDTVQYINRKGQRTKRRVIPDGYFVIDRQGEKLFRSRLFLELDMSTHSNAKFADEKIRASLKYMRSEVYKRRFGSNSGRWLIVVKGRDGASGKKRMKYLREKTAQVAGKNAVVFYFTLFDEISSEKFLTEPIWYRGQEEEPVALFPAR